MQGADLSHGEFASLECDVVPPWPFRMPGTGGVDRVAQVTDGVLARLLRVDGAPVLVRAWQLRDGRVRFRAEAVDPAEVRMPPIAQVPWRAGEDELAIAIERMRFALGVDEDLRPFYDMFRSDRLLGPIVRRRPWVRPRRRPWPWEALAWAITNQLIEASRAAQIQRRIVRRWGTELEATSLSDVPSAELIAGRAPAELVGMDLAEARAIAMVRCAREVAAGRIDLLDPASDQRLLSIPEVGPWTVQCLALGGRGDLDALPAGDLAYIKLVGHLSGLKRRATLAEVEDFFAPYAPYRGVAGSFMLVGYARALGPAAHLPFDAAAAMRRDLAA